MSPAGASLPRPRAVLFDWDNTLIDNWRSIQAALNVALVEAGKPPFDLEQVKISGRRSAREAFPLLFGETWLHSRKIFLAHFAEHHLAGLRVLPGAAELLDALEEQGVALGVVSNKVGDMLRREVAHLGWTTRFVAVVGAQDAPADKPDPAPVRFLLKTAEIEAGPEVWLVGDTDIDMRAGVAAGCTGILVGTETVDPALFEGAEPTLRFHSCTEFAGFVRRAWSTISNLSEG